MPKIYKVSGYCIDYEERTNLENVLNNIEDCFWQQLHIIPGETFTFDFDDPINSENCDMAECEKHFDHREEDDILNGRPIPVPGEMYRHFKTGHIVTVFAVCQDTEDMHRSVVYLCDGKIWNRPLDMFMSKTDKNKYPDADQEWRFVRVHD